MRTAVLTLALASTILAGFPGNAEPIAPDRIRVVDCDTIRVRGDDRSTRSWASMRPRRAAYSITSSAAT
jgi:hypothetical protein